VDPLLAKAAQMRFGQDLARDETEPALREFAAATWPDATALSAHMVFKTAIGEPAAVILQTAASEAVELIVMGTQGLSGFRKWLLGSTTERVLSRAHVPVLAVPPMSKDAGGSRADDQPFAVTHILAATDFSESSVAAVSYAAELGRQLSAALTLAHVVEPLSVAPQWRSLVEDETRVGNARTQLKALADQHCGSQGCETIVSAGRAADMIGSIAENRRAQLIVMGLSGNQGPFARRPGSIAYRVLSSTTVPVLVVPVPRKFPTDGDDRS
jgi:nucleotide-binding universal stress UspA family protein